MTDQTSTETVSFSFPTATEAPSGATTPDPTARHNVVWTRLEGDAAAFLTQCPGAIPVARLIWETANLASALTLRRIRMTADVRPAPPSSAQFVDEVMGYAFAQRGNKDLAALHALAHAGQRARAAAGHATATASSETDGGNCDG